MKAKRYKCKVCRDTGRVNCVLGSLQCGACSKDPLQVKARRAIAKTKKAKP